MACAMRPCRPITRPMSSGATCRRSTTRSPRRCSSTLTAAGSSTSARAMYSISSFIAALRDGSGCRARRRLAFVVEHARRAQQPLDRLRWLRTLAHPVAQLLDVDVERHRLGARIVHAKHLDVLAVARGAAIGDDDAIRRRLFPSHATQTDSQHVLLPNSP